MHSPSQHPRSIAVVPAIHLQGIASGGHQRTAALIEAAAAVSEVDIVAYEQGFSVAELRNAKLNPAPALRLPPWPSSGFFAPHRRLQAALAPIRQLHLAQAWSGPLAQLARNNRYAFCLFRYAEPFFQSGPMGTRCIVDYDDPMCERVLVRGMQAGICRRAIAMLHSRMLRSEYRKALKHAQAVLVTKPADIPLCPNAIGHVLPNVAFSVNQDHPPPPFDRAPTAIFIGTLNYAPNSDAVDHLLETIWPDVQRRVPESRLIVAGHGASETAMRRWRGCPSVQFRLNPATLLDAYTGSWIALNPMRLGSGSNIKLPEAMLLGRAVVTTPFGARGWETAGAANAGVFICADEQHFANQCTKLLQSFGVAAASGDAARRWASANASRATFLAKAKQLFQDTR